MRKSRIEQQPGDTAHLLRSPANAARLLESIKAANAGKTVEFDPTAEKRKAENRKAKDRRS